MISRLLAAILVALVWLVGAQPALAHEERTAGRYTLLVGLIGEPFLQGPRFGFEFWVTEAGRRVGDAGRALRVEVSRDGVGRSLAIVEREDAGHFEAAFSAPVDGSYELRIAGSIEGQPIDESFQFSLAQPEGGSPTNRSVEVSGVGPEPGLVAIVGAGIILIVALAAGLVIAARRAATA